jgi:hypothetical protein
MDVRDLLSEAYTRIEVIIGRRRDPRGSDRAPGMGRRYLKTGQRVYVPQIRNQLRPCRHRPPEIFNRFYVEIVGNIIALESDRSAIPQGIQFTQQGADVEVALIQGY